MTIKKLLGKSTAAADSVKHFENQFPSKECGLRDRSALLMQRSYVANPT